MQDPQQAPVPDAKLASTWRRYLRFWGPRADADVDDELRFHFEMRVRDYVARGMSEDDARAAVIRRWGDFVGVRQECISITSRRERRMVRAQVVDALLQDVRFAVRTLGRQKGWTLAAVLTLSLGIGANTAVFSVVNSLILHPIPYPHADRLAIAFQEPTTGNATGVRVRITPRPAVVRAWLQGSRAFEALEAYRTSDVTLEQRGETPALLHVAFVRPRFPEFAGQRPLIGRFASPSDIAVRAPVAMLSEGAWRARFGADSAVLGKSLTLNDRIYTIVGVMPQSLRVPRLSLSPTDVWLPLEVTDDDASGLTVIGRLRDGETFASATRELDAIDAALGDQKPGQGRFRAKLVAPGELVSFRESLKLLSAAVAFVLLIACANVAHLLLARAAARQRELAVRGALGASRGRLFRQLMTESLLLAAVGCAGGLAIGWVALRAAATLRPSSLSELSVATLDTTALLVTATLSVITGIGFGLVGAVQAVRQSTHESLKTGALTISHARRHNRLRSLLVVSEMALSTTLLVAAGLLVRSVIHLQTIDPGFQPRGLYALAAGLPERRYPNEETKRAFYQRLVDGARALPGVEGATLADGAPPGFNFMIGALQVDGDPPPTAGTTSFLKYNAVEPGFFRMMRMRLVEGTTFTDSTRGGRELIVNQGFARKYWRGQSALGRKVRIVHYDGHGEWLTIVGVAADASTGGLTDQGSDPFLYLPAPDFYSPALIVRMKTGIDVMPALRSLVASLDPHLPPPSLVNIDDAMRSSAALPRFTMTLLTAFTGIALVLAAIGLYGVMAYAVAQRTREIGIRIALGATRRTIVRALVSNGLLLAAAGATLGAAGAWWATKLVENMLYGVTRTDPLSFVLAVMILLVTALFACVLPTNRAAAVDPLIAMRAD